MPARVLEDALAGGTDGVPNDIGETFAPDDIVLAGISCRLPESENMAEFREHLIKGEDMVTECDRRWEPGLHGLPKRSGAIKDISRFDAAFFGVHPKQANTMDPQLRMLLEITYEAIADSGINPADMRGTKTGVFVGSSGSEAHEAWAQDAEKINGYEMTGCTRSMFANRLSYSFDFKGPSYSVDTACSSGLVCLDIAVQSIRSGQCDAAIAAASNLCLKPGSALQFMRLGMLSQYGACRSFDESGAGYCRSEAVVAVFLQKAPDAKRIYATVVHSKQNSDGNKSEGITFPNGQIQKKLIQEIYSECKVDPADIEYVEAHGTGTKAGDPQELNSIVDVFCKKGRQGPLLIGSTKSNMGHPEAPSGLAALAKCIIAMEDQMIPANLHFQAPNPTIPGLNDGRLKVVTERTKWNKGYMGINSFGFGGSNAHVLLKPNKTPPPGIHPAAKETRLFTFCGRSKDGVRHTLEQMLEQPANVELQTLLQNNAAASTATHPYRGYTILNHDNKVIEIENSPSEPGPIWYVFAGMGTQWVGMGKELMPLEIFRASIMRSDAILKQHGLNLYNILMEGDESTFENTLNSFVGIAAIQVALVDVLKGYGIKPDGIVGHSVGELGCAYADGGLTAEETVLAAYWRGRCVNEANLPAGGMAAVGLTWEQAKKRCPEGVVAACHNAVDTVTISGPKDAVHVFVEKLKEEGLFAKEVKSAGVAFHSYFMAKTAPALKAALDKVIKEPRPRTSRWISSSIPEQRWGEDLAKTSSAAYHVNNLVSPVLFQEALQHVPKNAIVIEIAPHCLLQAILKRSLGSECTFVGLMKRNHSNNFEFLMSSLGKVYMAGAKFNPLEIYPKVSYPVSPGTPMVGPMIKWDHAIAWDIPTAESFVYSSGGRSDCVFEVEAGPEDSEDHYMLGHKIDGRVLYPATGYLTLAWRALAKTKGLVYEQMPVAFENVQIQRATMLPKSGTVKFEVTIMQGSGDFEVFENGSSVVSGKIYVPNDPVMQVPTYDPLPDGAGPNSIRLTPNDIYKELRLRGYDYGPTFQGIIDANNRGDEGHLLWNDRWVSFLDTMLQIMILAVPGPGLKLPTRIKSVRIDPTVHEQKIKDFNGQKAAHVVVDRILDTCIAGGAEILGLHATVAPRRQEGMNPTMEEFHFVPYKQTDISSGDIDLASYMKVCQRFITSSLKSLLDNGIADKLPNVDLLRWCSKQDVGVAVTATELSRYAEKPECGLLQVLMKAFSQPHDDNFTANIRNILQSNRDLLAKDWLLGNLVTPQTLKPLVDIVLENSASQNLKAFELDGTNFDFYKHIIPLLNSQPLLQLAYSTVAANTDTLDKKVLDQYSVKASAWDPKKYPPNNLRAADLVLASGVLSQTNDLRSFLRRIRTMVKENGFVLIHEYTHNLSLPMVLLGLSKELETDSSRSVGCFLDESKWQSLFVRLDLELVAQKSDGLLSTVFLCRKRPSLPPNPTFMNISDAQYSWVEDLKNLIQEQQSKPTGHNIWLVADSCPSHGIVGMVNCLRKEPGGNKLRCVFNASLKKNSKPPSLEEGSPSMQQLMRGDLVMNIYRDGQWGSFRHLPLTTGADALVTTPHAYVNVLNRGDLSSLRWIESPVKFFNPATQTDKELCSVYYTSLNFRDVMLATGRLPPDAIPGDMASQDCILGMEFSGRNQEGKRIMGLLPAKGLATTVDVDSRFLWDVPNHWTLEEAATIPVVYATVYYALVVRGGIRRGDKVLIHSGSGGVGQAAISVALHQGCEVFTTVGTKEKREYLKQRFPQMSDRHFANSRDRTFEWDILRATNGKGVDAVLNSLAEEKLQASLRILAPHGKFLEIGKFDLSNNTPLGMSIFLRNVTFHGILLDALFEPGNQDWHVVSQLLQQGIKDGVVKPLRTTVFDRDDIEGAFRFMAQGKHIGKVVLKVREEEAVKCTCASQMTLSAIPRSACHPEKVYIITGGLGGFGLELAQWLAERGAKYLVLTSRSGIRNGYQARKVRYLQDLGVSVTVLTYNTRTNREAEQLVREAQKIGNVGGVFHLAVVLNDGFFENQTTETFLKVGEPKVIGTRTLDAATRKLCRDSCDWFVVFSSVSCGRGNAGQSNYGFANSTMERICEQRRNDGLQGLAIQWGAIGDVGLVMDGLGGNETVVGGTLPQRIASCMASLDTFLSSKAAVVSSFVMAEKVSKGESAAKADLVGSVAHIMGVKDVSNLNPDMTLGDLGLDSLMSVEVRMVLEHTYEMNLTVKEVRQLTVNKLRDIESSAGGVGEKEDMAVENYLDILEELLKYDLYRIMPIDDIVKLKEGTGQPIFMVHPIEGGATSLQVVAAHLDGPVYAFQCTRNCPMETPGTMADYYINLMRTIQPEGPYRIVAYSFGCFVAFEMALHLENNFGNQSLLEYLVFLDGSHAYVAAHTKQYLSKLQSESDQEAESECMCIFVMQFMEHEYRKLSDEMLAQPNWESRVNLAVHKLTTNIEMFAGREEELAAAAKSLYGKLLISGEYEPPTTLRSDILLIRAKIGHQTSDELGEDYSLSKVCSGKIALKYVEGDHETFVLGNSGSMVAGTIQNYIKNKGQVV